MYDTMYDIAKVGDASLNGSEVGHGTSGNKLGCHGTEHGGLFAQDILDSKEVDNGALNGSEVMQSHM